jgi:glycosyltransferase involved in cell wall biosynthesis
MRGLDVVAIPSLWEACPLLPMEAMMVGTPVIGTNCLGLREVLEGTPSTVVPLGDARALEGAIVQHLDGSHKAAAAAYAAHARQRFDVDAAAASLGELLLATVCRQPEKNKKTTGVAT